MCQFKFCRDQRRYFTSTKQLCIEPASYSALAFASKSTVGLPVGLLAPFLTILGLGYVLYNVTTDSVLSTGNTREVVERSLYLGQIGFELHCKVHDFMYNLGSNLNSYNYSELSSIYDSLNQLYVEIYGYIKNLDSLGESSASVRDNGNTSRN